MNLYGLLKFRLKGFRVSTALVVPLKLIPNSPQLLQAKNCVPASVPHFDLWTNEMTLPLLLFLLSARDLCGPASSIWELVCSLLMKAESSGFFNFVSTQQSVSR